MSTTKDLFSDDDTPVGIQHVATISEALAGRVQEFLEFRGIEAHFLDRRTYQNDTGSFTGYGVMAFCTYAQMRKAFSLGLVDCSQSDYQLMEDGLTDQEDFGMSQFTCRVIKRSPDGDTKEPFPF